VSALVLRLCWLLGLITIFPVGLTEIDDEIIVSR
jgi:hypothetical protein